MFKKILIANRGEIAVRIIRTCKLMYIQTIAIYSYDDRYSIHIYMANKSFCIGLSRNSYLDMNSIIKIAKFNNVDAIHPGYGFLSENSIFARLVEKNNIVFIGPSSNIIEKFGNKVMSLKLAKENNLNILPSYIWSQNTTKNTLAIKKIGYPFMIKPVYGGGGKGIRIINNKFDLTNSLSLSKHEAALSYNTSDIYIEKYIKNARHIELQVICDKNKQFVIGYRECSVQDKHQKFIEETPVSNIKNILLQKIKNSCELFLKNISYCNIGTIEFLYKNDVFYFLEVNPRLQVEHTVTENKYDIDLVKIQIELAYNKNININIFNMKKIGYYIQCRINIKNYKENKIKFLHIPAGNGIRFDSHIYNGYKIPVQYDKLIGKLIAHGTTRNDAIKKLLVALDEIIIYNLDTNINIIKKILTSKIFKNNKVTTNFLKKIIK